MNNPFEAFCQNKLLPVHLIGQFLSYLTSKGIVNPTYLTLVAEWKIFTANIAKKMEQQQ